MQGSKNNEKSPLSICRGAFKESGIEVFYVPSSITSIEAETFYGCKNLKTVFFQKDNRLKKIKRLAFIFSSIEEISLPNSLSKIGNFAFSG